MTFILKQATIFLLGMVLIGAIIMSQMVTQSHSVQTPTPAHKQQSSDKSFVIEQNMHRNNDQLHDKLEEQTGNIEDERDLGKANEVKLFDAETSNVEDLTATGSTHALLHSSAQQSIYDYLFDPEQEANFTHIVRMALQLAETGDSNAQHITATLYALGLIETADSQYKIDEEHAVLYDYFAAINGDFRAMLTLGFRHMYGLSVPQSCEASESYYSLIAQDVATDLIDSDLRYDRLKVSNERSFRLDEDDNILHFYMQAADKGDVAAQSTLGHLFMFGNGENLEPNLQRAAFYFRMAAAQSEPNAMAQLAQMYASGHGVPQNNSTAIALFQNAANYGHAGAMNGLGYIYMHGHGVERNFTKALELFKQSADLGFIDAYFNLATMQLLGLGTPRNLSLALQNFGIAAAGGHTKALFYTAHIHAMGLGVIQACPLAIKLLKTVAERSVYAKILPIAHRAYSVGNVKKAWLLYAIAAEEGFEVAQINSAYLLSEERARYLDVQSSFFPFGIGAGDGLFSIPDFSNNVHEQYLVMSLMQRHLTSASLQGSVDSLRQLGDLAFDNFEADGSNLHLAVKYYKKAADLGNAQAMFNLGYMHEHSLGLPRDFNLAKRYYDLAIASDPIHAHAPATLALWILWLRQRLQVLFSFFNFMTNDNDSSQPTSNVVPNDNDMSNSGIRWSALRSLLLYIEDVILFALCGVLAFVIYIRAQPIQAAASVSLRQRQRREARPVELPGAH